MSFANKNKGLTLTVFSVCLLIFSCQKKNQEDIAFNADVSKISSEILVETFILKDSTFNKQIICNGKIEALKKSELRFKTSDRLKTLKVKNGQKVKKGQVLATLDNSILLNQLNKAKLDLEKAESKLQEAKINFGVSNTNNISPTVLKNLEIKSGYLEAKNAIENASLLYNQTILKAPLSGVIANIETKKGNYITSSDVFCTIIAQQELEVVFFILENELSFIKKRLHVEVTSFSNKEAVYKGEITEINPLVDKNGLIKVNAKINTPYNGLFDGMHAKVVINQPLENVYVIPKEALVLRSNKEIVFTAENGLSKWNYVDVLDENSTSYAIKKDLKPGDTIIISGNMNLSHDAKVTTSFISKEKFN